MSKPKKMWYTRNDDGKAQVWLGTQAPEKDDDGEYDGWGQFEDECLDVVAILPCHNLEDADSEYLLAALRPRGVRKGRCVKIKISAKAK